MKIEIPLWRPHYYTVTRKWMLHLKGLEGGSQRIEEPFDSERHAQEMANLLNEELIANHKATLRKLLLSRVSSR